MTIPPIDFLDYQLAGASSQPAAAAALPFWSHAQVLWAYMYSLAHQSNIDCPEQVAGICL